MAEAKPVSPDMPDFRQSRRQKKQALGKNPIQPYKTPSQRLEERLQRQENIDRVLSPKKEENVKVCLMLYPPGNQCVRLSGDGKDLILVPPGVSAAYTEFPTIPNERDRFMFTSGIYEVVRRVFDFSVKPPKVMCVIKRVSKG